MICSIVMFLKVNNLGSCMNEEALISRWPLNSPFCQISEIKRFANAISCLRCSILKWPKEAEKW